MKKIKVLLLIALLSTTFTACNVSVSFDNDKKTEESNDENTKENDEETSEDANVTKDTNENEDEIESEDNEINEESEEVQDDTETDINEADLSDDILLEDFNNLETKMYVSDYYMFINDRFASGLEIGESYDYNQLIDALLLDNETGESIDADLVLYGAYRLEQPKQELAYNFVFVFSNDSIGDITFNVLAHVDSGALYLDAVADSYENHNKYVNKYGTVMDENFYGIDYSETNYYVPVNNDYANYLYFMSRYDSINCHSIDDGSDPENTNQLNNLMDEFAKLEDDGLFITKYCINSNYFYTVSANQDANYDEIMAIAQKNDFEFISSEDVNSFIKQYIASFNIDSSVLDDDYVFDYLEEDPGFIFVEK